MLARALGDARGSWTQAKGQKGKDMGVHLTGDKQENYTGEGGGSGRESVEKIQSQFG